ncbi:MAG TPA: hypothetical protein VHG51_02990 [Longimicrobiaceae bacterium]|nr:hypothetical protein [Longimicrobiaceae bacterium]
MSLVSFQRAMADLVASPELCRELRRDPAPVLDRYDLTEVERRRLAQAAAHRGMAVNCTLYRANRIGVVYTVLGCACFVLGDRLRDEVDRFWAEWGKPDFQAQRELHRFADFLRRRMAAGELRSPYLEEVLEWELAVYDSGFVPRRETLAALARGERADAPLRLHPLLRVVTFRHDPLALLPQLQARRPPPWEADEGEFYLLVDRRGESRAASRVDARAGRALRAVQAGEEVPAAETEVLRAAGLLVRMG